MRYGHFDNEPREYVITRPDTPLPWINYLGSEAYFGIISNTAGGYSFYRDARLRRLTRYRYNNAPLDLGGRYIYLRDDETGRLLEPELAADPERPGGLQLPARPRLLDHRLALRRRSGPRPATSCRSARTSRSGGSASPTSGWSRRRLSLFSSIEFCLWEALDDNTNFQRNYSTGQVEIEDGVIYHKTEYRERRDHFAYFACSEPLAGFDTQRDAFLGPYRGWDRPIVVESGQATDSEAHGWQPMGSHHVRLELAAGRDRARSSSCSATGRTPGTTSSTRPALRRSTSKTVKPVIARYLAAGRGRGGIRGPARLLDRAARHAPGRDRRRARRPDGQHLERLPVHGDVQHVALGVRVRVRHRAGHGLPRLQPGPARLRPHDPGPRARADPRHRRDAAAQRRRVPPVPAADQARQQRDRLRLQRRSGLAGPRRGRVPQGDRRHLDPRRAGAVRQRARRRRRRCTSISSAASRTPSTGSVPTACRSSAGPTGTTA